MIRFFLLFALFLAGPRLYPDPYSSSQDGFRFDLPPGYQMTGKQGRRFSFLNPQGSVFEIAAEPGQGEPETLLGRTLSRLGNRGELESFDYHGRKAALARLDFAMGGKAYLGWGLCLEREKDQLLALAYGPRENSQELFHLSVLDSIAPTAAEQLYWGPVTEYTWPRGEQRETPLYNSGVSAMIAAGDAEAAQGLVDREFQVLKEFTGSPQWQEAWRRF
ncbi:MAG: hypothetical protein LBB77_05000, partial [Treponema sp.]|nr:hypothetical protein [Treponema sp.]